MILCGSAEVTFRKNSRSLEVDGCGVFSSSQSREKLTGVLEQAVLNSEALDE